MLKLCGKEFDEEPDISIMSKYLQINHVLIVNGQSDYT